MASVLKFSQVSVLRGGRKILGPIDWNITSDQRWVVLGPNGAGKSTLFSLAGALIHPTKGSVDILDSRLGKTDVFELRPRIGITSQLVMNHIPEDERVLDVVLTSLAAANSARKGPKQSSNRDRDSSRRRNPSWNDTLLTVK